jgi:hypothetical protein
MAAFWYTAPCSLVEVERRFSGAIYFHETTRRNITEGCLLQARLHENLKSQIKKNAWYTVIFFEGI